jgi:hypothetical protein
MKHQFQHAAFQGFCANPALTWIKPAEIAKGIRL